MTDRELVQKAIEMQNYAYCPYSNFPVGAAILCADGTVFTGCNVESAAYGSTICAERTALLKAVSDGHQADWMAIAVAGKSEKPCWPCGSCRQMLYEFAPNLRVLAVRGDGTWEEATLSDLLPHGFGAAHLG